jgi:mono/diheme cytochrome c family protein
MRHIALLIPVLLVAAWSCNDSEAHEPVFGAELPATHFTVDPARDTVLKTPGGALISVFAGSLDAGNGNAVTLEVKEAYSQEDMTRGGLLHGSSEGDNSAGIIYVNVTGGQAVSIHKPMDISIPAKTAGSEMMVYKGVAGDDALLKWTEARSLNNTPAHQPSDAGKTLFESRCASCHGGKEEIAGPPLAWITSRRDRQWLYAFTRNNAILLWRGDAYSCYLFNRYKNPMPLFKDLTDADLGNLYNYIASASKSVDSNAVADHKRGFDSCLANDHNCAAAAQRVAHTDSVTAAPAEAPVADFYTFSIDKHGWYNVSGKTGAQPVVADLFPAVSADSLHPAPEPLQACPCWCNESAYRRADSLGRERPARRH